MKLNPENAGWAVIATLVAAGGLAYVARKLMEPTGIPIAGAAPQLPTVPCGSWTPLYHDGVLAGVWVDGAAAGQCRLQCEPGYMLTADGSACVPASVSCAQKPAGPQAPYGWMSDGAGGCIPVPTPAGDINCSDRQIWTGSNCVTPAWNRLPEPPTFTPNVWLPAANQNEMQIYSADASKLDALGYLSNAEGVWAFQKEFNLVNSLLDEQGSPPMGQLTLNEDGLITDDTRRALGWSMSYQTHTGDDWVGIVTRSEELVA